MLPRAFVEVRRKKLSCLIDRKRIHPQDFKDLEMFFYFFIGDSKERVLTAFEAVCLSVFPGPLPFPQSTGSHSFAQAGE